MDQQCKATAGASQFWQKALTSLRRLPTTAWIILGLFLVAATLMAFHTAFVAPDAMLRLKVQHNLRSGQLSVWVDGKAEYSGKLAGTVKRKFGLIPEVQGSLSETLLVSSGKHQVRIQVLSDDGSVQEDTIAGEFAPNAQRILAVVARHGSISLTWQGVEPSMAESVSSNNGWLGRYAGSLMMTVVGSVVSALAGYMIRELPKQIASRRGNVPEA